MLRFLNAIIYIALVVYAIIDLLNSDRSTEQKIVWALVIIFIPVVGAIFYLMVSKGIIKL